MTSNWMIGRPDQQIYFADDMCSFAVKRKAVNDSANFTAKEGLVRIQYKCLVPIFFAFPEIKLLFLKQNYNGLPPSSFTHISVIDLYISRISLPILLQGNMWTDPGNT
jgi:hypothetical protein